MAFDFNQVLEYAIFGNPVRDWFLALVAFVIVFVILRFFKYQVVKTLKRLSKKTKSEIDDLLIEAIEGLGWPLYIMVCIYAAVRFVQVPGIVDSAVYYVLILVAAYYVIRSVQRAMDFSAKRFVKKREREGKKVDTTIIDLFKKMLKALLWLAVVLFIISSLGYDISGIVVGLGVGGIVIGFALQNVLSDVFASFSIYFDRPFEKGDFIIIGDDLGVVDKIGIKSTRIKHLKGHELVVSNRELTSTRINNYKKMKKRRISFAFGVVYQTPSKKLKKIPQIVKKIIEGVELAELDRVHFKDFGDFSLNYEVVYYVGTSDYNKYMDIQQEINLKLVEEFEKEGIEFAYPTQTIFLSKEQG